MREFQPTLFEGGQRLVYDDAVEMTLQSMQAYGQQHDHWGIAWSGGKDSSAVLTLIVHLLDAGRLAPPKTLSVFYADTRQELPPLAIAAQLIMRQLAERNINLEIVTAPLDKRFLVYMLGRGVPPPNNNTLRWCTRQIKVDPMTDALAARIEELDSSILMITGVRQGESAVRDQRIAMSCGKDGAECGQGWYQQVLPNAKGIRGRIATLAPILHWRVCNVWDWLKIYAPMRDYGSWATASIADAYGGDEAAEIAARTGCIGCPLASRELALETILTNPDWYYLEPLQGLKQLYRELRLPQHRLRKPGAETLKDGTIAKNPQRMGPLTFDARLMALARVIAIQEAVNTSARNLGRPEIDILNAEEEARIRELISLETWPKGWTGSEPTADTPLDTVYGDGTVQPLMM
ncbi:phosphoadenosine phosphosulfate reductase family protein [Roseibium algicola]|uniref:phosphoadenosine phosphosulfate reductase domain-containing protein n=1 Tax=Roseibium algicola TaxID=2857014 RepID=UPI003457DC0A